MVTLKIVCLSGRMFTINVAPTDRLQLVRQRIVRQEELGKIMEVQLFCGNDIVRDDQLVAELSLDVLQLLVSRRPYFVTGSADGTMRIWDAQECGNLSTIHVHTKAGTMLLSTIYLADNLLASGSSDGSVRIWCLRRVKCLKTLCPGHRQAVHALAQLSDGTRLASGSDDGAVKIWHIESGELHMEFECPCEVRDIAALNCGSGSSLACGCGDGNIRVLCCHW